MPHKTKAQRAAYMRKWRERQQSGSAGRGEVPASRVVEDSVDQAAVSPLPSAPEIQTAPPDAVHIQSTPVADTHTVLPFLAAPVDECPICHHDRQENDHLGGRPCKFKTSPRRNCGCMFEGF